VRQTGIRCFSKFVYDKKLTDNLKLMLTSRTKSGIKTIELEKEGDEITRARVDMEMPILKTKDIPMRGLMKNASTSL